MKRNWIALVSYGIINIATTLSKQLYYFLSIEAHGSSNSY